MNRSRQNWTFASLSMLVVVVAIAVGFWLLGSPAKRRQISADQQRLNDLRAIAYDLRQSYAANLPNSLPATIRKNDPISEKPYEYRRIDKTRYELCADFATNSNEDRFQQSSLERERFWQHPSGRHCLQLNVKDSPQF